jgi:DNA ligase-1
VNQQTWATLYRKNGHDGLQQWNIHVEPLNPCDGPVPPEMHGVIVKRWGQEGGVIQQTRDVVKEGKNGGKKNATTPFEQAVREARSKWEKQQKKGYHQDRAAALAGQVDDDFVKGGIAPMLAASFPVSGDAIVYPALLQPKSDGFRCEAIYEDGVCTLWSRSRNLILSVPHIAREVEAMAKRLGLMRMVLDGELYHHDLHDDFQRLASLLRKQTPQPECAFVQYHVYDIPDAEAGGYGVRHQALCRFFAGEPAESHLKLVETILINSEEEALEAFEHFLALKYEGAMVRNVEGAYHHARHSSDRSLNLQKLKKFDDAEFEIVGVVEGRGRLAGHAVFVCKREVKPGVFVEFNAKKKGPQAELKGYLTNPPIGAQLTVKFQGFYKSGKPRIPVAWRLREDL